MLLPALLRWLSLRPLLSLGSRLLPLRSLLALLLPALEALLPLIALGLIQNQLLPEPVDFSSGDITVDPENRA